MILIHIGRLWLRSADPIVVSPNEWAEWQRRIDSVERYSTTNPVFSGEIKVNSWDEEDWGNAGLNPDLAKRIIKFRDRIGGYSDQNDLLRVWGMDTNWVLNVSDQLDFSLESEKGKKEFRGLRTFDPNNISLEELKSMGVPYGFARNWTSYLKAGGSFFQPEDIYRIYSADSAIVEPLIPFMVFHLSVDSGNAQVTEVDLPENWNINLMDSLDFLEWKGVGPTLAHRILKYRSKLGGFFEEQQFQEVYGISDEVVQGVEGEMIFDPGHIRKWDINRATEEELASHPYISRRLAREIVQFRENFRPYKNVEELEHLQLMTGDKMRKIAPYLTIDHH